MNANNIVFGLTISICLFIIIRTIKRGFDQANRDFPIKKKD
jgi:hypothetical protein